MTQLTKLGDVAAYLRKGDSLKWGSLRLSVASELEDGAVGVVGIRLSGDASRLNVAHEVELLNPRWVPYYGDNAPARVEQQCLLLSRGEPLTVAEFYERNINDAGAQVLCRDINGQLEPVRAGELPRETDGYGLKRGDLIDYCGGKFLVTSIEPDWSFPVRLLDPAAGSTDGNRMTTRVTLLSRNNPIPGETLTTTTQTPVTGVDSFGNRHTSKPQPDTLPRLVKGSELRAGDEWKHPDDSTRYRVVSLASTHRDYAFDSVMVNREDAGTFFTHVDDDVQLLSRAEPAYRTAPQPEAPAIDADRLRREWEYLAERTPWDAIVSVCRQRVYDGVTEQSARGDADYAFEKALGALSRKERGLSRHGLFLVVIQPENRDIPIELYSLTLNATAYHAKVAELWPKPAEPAKRAVACKCGAACGPKSASLCGDCLMVLDRKMDSRHRDHDPTNRFRGLPPAPGVHLSPGAIYHLQDDVDTWGIPSHG